MTINPYLPPRASLEDGEKTWRANSYWRFGNWLYGAAMLVSLVSLARGGSLTPESGTLTTLVCFLAPMAGYYVSVSASTDSAYKLWRIAHLFIVCFLLWLAMDNAVRGVPTPAVGWSLIAINVLSFATNEIFSRVRSAGSG